jgi:hypothetical protein
MSRKERNEHSSIASAGSLRVSASSNGLPFALGAKVRLRHCAFGEPGTVLRIERCKLSVFWHDLDFLGRHSPESLMLAAERMTENEMVKAEGFR